MAFTRENNLFSICVVEMHSNGIDIKSNITTAFRMLRGVGFFHKKKKKKDIFFVLSNSSEKVFLIYFISGTRRMFPSAPV